MIYDIIVNTPLIKSCQINCTGSRIFYPEQYNIFEWTSVAKYSIFTEPNTHTKNSNYKK